MKKAENLIELKKNLKTLDKYLNSKKDPEYSFGVELIKKGICFVAVEENGKYKFYPSRFIGYLNNSMNAHQNNGSKNGTTTNLIISKMLGSKPIQNGVLNNLYCEYCESLGFEAYNRSKRKFWEVC